MDKISRLTSRGLSKINLNNAANAALVCHEAGKVIENIFGKDFAREVGVISFRDGSIYLSTNSSGYAQEIVLKEREIVERINALLPNKSVKKIRFKNRANEPASN